MIDFIRRVRRRWPAEKNERRALVLDCPELWPLGTLPPPYERIGVGWAEMMAEVRHEPPSSVAIVHPMLGGAPDPRVRELVEAAGLVPVVAVVPFDDAHAPHLPTLLAWGVAELADAAFEAAPRAILPRLHAVHAAPFKRVLEPQLSRFVSMQALTLVRAAASVAVDRGAAPDLALTFGSGERTVAGWCAREALPPPRRLIAWMRLLLALALLDPPGRTVMDAARCAGYRDHSLRRAVRDFLGEGMLPRPGLFATAAAVLNAELRDLRERAREARPGARAD
jgi:hypothetical protein